MMSLLAGKLNSDKEKNETIPAQAHVGGGGKGGGGEKRNKQLIYLGGGWIGPSCGGGGMAGKQSKRRVWLLIHILSVKLSIQS